jgi:hypothetical protein
MLQTLKHVQGDFFNNQLENYFVRPPSNKNLLIVQHVKFSKKLLKFSSKCRSPIMLVLTQHVVEYF